MDIEETQMNPPREKLLHLRKSVQDIVTDPTAEDSKLSDVEPKLLDHARNLEEERKQFVEKDQGLQQESLASGVKVLDLEEKLEKERIVWEEEKDELIKEDQELQNEFSDPMTKYREKPKLVKKIYLGHSVWGLAMLNKELFVASLGAVAIFVYDPVSYKRLRTIHLEGSVRPRDIAACQEKNCLFVVDLVSGPSLFCIDKMGKILKQWQVPYEPHNLSVMSSGNILLTCNARILIYNSDGNYIQNLRLDANDLDKSWQTILLRSGNYLVCQGWIRSKHQRVLRLSPDGAILKSFGSNRQHSNSHLSNPVYMAMDRDELILVADSGNNRVVLLSQELVFLKELLNKDDGVIQPYRVLLDEASKLLYVGTNDGHLLIFNVFQ